MDIRVMKDKGKQEFIASARFDEMDFIRAIDERGFYLEIYRQIAFKLADKVIEKIGPAIDRALEELKIEAKEVA